MSYNKTVRRLSLLLVLGFTCVFGTSVWSAEMCGGLISGPSGCPLFIPDSLGIALELDDYGTFQPGDYVRVNGQLEMGCTPVCPDAVGCIQTVSIALCEEITAYSGCGVMYDMDQCLLFVPDNEPNQAWKLDLEIDYFSGQEICIQGSLNLNCSSDCQAATGCVTNAQVDNGHTEYPVNACGMLVQHGQCLYFEPIMGLGGPVGAVFVLDYFGEFGSGDAVCVSGLIIDSCEDFCQEAAGCIQVWEINSADSTAYSFSDCGVLIQGTDCILFEPNSTPGSYLLLDNYGGFGAGDSVYVIGEMTPSCDLLCPEATGCVVNNSIDDKCVPFGPFYFGEGIMVDSVGCLLFNPFNSPADLYQLDNTPGVLPGDTVMVDGLLNLECTSSCVAATGCINYNIIIPISNSFGGELLIQMVPGYPIEPVIAMFQGMVLDSLVAPNTYLVDFPGVGTLEQIAMQIMMYEGVVSVQPNNLLSIPEGHQMSISFPDESAPMYVELISPDAFYSQSGNEALGIDSAQLLVQTSVITVAVIDNGINSNHPLFALADISGGYDFVDNDNDPSEEPGQHRGHGTFVAGLIRLVAPDCHIMPVRALDSDGNGSNFSVVQAIYYAIENGADVINMSFGMPASNAALATVISDAHEAGIVMVASVGNEATSQETYPAAFVRVVAVSALDNTESPASFTNNGSYVDLCAPGEDVYSALDGLYDWGTWTGTSFSAPLVTGTCALLLGRDPELSPLEVRDILRQSARDNLASGVYDVPDDYVGYGCLDAFAAGLGQARGDFDNSGDITINDLVMLTAYMFTEGEPPAVSMKVSDLNCDNSVDITDLLALVDYMFFDQAATWPCYDSD